jgi:hypothetical protein
MGTGKSKSPPKVEREGSNLSKSVQLVRTSHYIVANGVPTSLTVRDTAQTQMPAVSLIYVQVPESIPVLKYSHLGLLGH